MNVSFLLLPELPPRRGAGLQRGREDHSRPLGGGHFGVPSPKLWDPSEGEEHSGLASQG